MLARLLYIWLERWNKGGLEGLEPNYGGKPPELSQDGEELKQILEGRDDEYYILINK